MITSRTDPALFDEFYFRHGCGQPYERTPQWLEFFGGIAEAIVRKISPRTVLDAGCAMGFLVEALRQRGVEAWGVDVSEYAIERVHPEMQPYCRLGSITAPFERDYDLIVCIEVLEHMTAGESEQAVKNFCEHAGDVLFSSTPFDYKEATHFNVQPPEYWAELFAQYGFFRDVDFDASFITDWAVRFRRNREPVHRVVRAYERRFSLLQKENFDLRRLASEMRDQFYSLQKQLAEKEDGIQSLHSQVYELNNQVAQKEQVIVSLNSQINEVLNSRSWRIAQRAQKIRLWLAPLGSSREQWIRGVIQIFRPKTSSPGSGPRELGSHQ